MKTTTVGGVYSESKCRFKLTNIREQKHHRRSSRIQKEIGICTYAKNNKCYEINITETNWQVRILLTTYHITVKTIKYMN
jgi:hypothetical protein